MSVSYTHLDVYERQEQYRWADDEARWVGVAREMIGAKIAKCRSLLLRAQRTYGKDLSEAIDRLAAARYD